MRMKKLSGKILIHVVLILGAATMVFPFLWMLATSLKTLTESMQVPPGIFPKALMVENYLQVWTTFPFFDFFKNTFLMVLFRVIFAIVFSSMAAYAFARIKFPGRNLFFMIVLIQFMVPSQIYIIPQYMLAAKLGWLNTIKALVLPGTVSAFGTFLLRQFYMGIPIELEEAGILDGCSRWNLYLKIFLPLSHSSLAALSIFTILFAWKDLLWPLVVNMSVQKMTLSAGIASLKGQYLSNYPQLMAGSMIAIIPMVVLFLVFQKQFIQGITTTGSKN